MIGDTWFLGVCCWWFVREAFLPPVDDSDWIPGGLLPSAAPANPLTRGWFGSAFEAQNYLVPLVPVAIYIVIQVFFFIR